MPRRGDGAGVLAGARPAPNVLDVRDESCGRRRGDGLLHPCRATWGDPVTAPGEQELWLEFVNRNHCGLCGNTGYVDTRGVCTPAGLEVGVRRPCICPNGRAIRRKEQT